MRNLIFDLDGTIIDPREGITESCQKALAELGVEVADANSLSWIIGPAIRTSMGSLLSTDDPELIEKGVALYRKHYCNSGIYHHQLYEGIAGIIQELSAGGRQRLFVATVKPQVFAAEILEKLNLAGCFVRIYGTDMQGTYDDKSKLLAWLVTTERISSAECVMIGDRCHDIQAGRNCGMQTAGVLWGYGSKEELTQAGANYLLRRPPELLGLAESPLKADSRL